MSAIDEIFAPVVELLRAQGYREYPAPFGEGWLFGKNLPLGTPECECNDRPPQWLVYLHRLDLGGRAPSYSVTLEICGERGGRWWKLQCYSLRPEEVTEAALGAVEQTLLQVWVVSVGPVVAG